MSQAICSRVNSSSDPQQLPCSVPAAPGSRLSFTWGTGCQLLVTESSCPSTGAGGDQPFASACEWGTLVATQRKTAYQLLPIYTMLQENLLQPGGGMHEQAHVARQQYSDAVYDVLMENRSLDLTLSGASSQIASEAAVWQLLSFFFASYDDQDSGAFSEAFAAWMLQHGALLTADAPDVQQLHAQLQELLQDPQADTAAAYWGTLHRLVLLGQLDGATELLLHHPIYRASQEEAMGNLVQPFEAVYGLLSTVPRLDRQTGSTADIQCSGGQFINDIVLFGEERANWESRATELYQARRELLGELQDADPAAAKGLAAVLQMLCSDFNRVHPQQSAACKQMVKVAWNWVELLTGMLLWQHRDIPLLRLKNLVNAAVQMQQQPRYANSEFIDFLHELLLAACQQEVQDVVRICTNSPFTSLQFVVHIFEVLRALPEAAGVLARPLPHMGCDQAESFMLNYVEVLLGSASTWLTGAQYLAWCPVYGADALQVVLDTCPHVLSDQQSGLKGLSLARKHSLTAASYNLARRLAAHARHTGQMAATLHWALQAHDSQLCAELVAPLMSDIQQQLLAQVGSFQASPLDVPQLQDLQPLLLNLPRGDADVEVTKEHQQAARTPRYPELHCLRAVLNLQLALQDVKACQQRGEVQPGQDIGRALNETSQQPAAALTAAYARLQQPVQELLIMGLAPAALRLPLLLWIAPIIESAHMPFSKPDIMGLLRVITSTSNGLPSIAAAVLDGSHGSLPGVEWPTAFSEKGGLSTSAVSAARLALCRGLARAHVAETAVQV